MAVLEMPCYTFTTSIGGNIYPNHKRPDGENGLFQWREHCYRHTVCFRNDARLWNHLSSSNFTTKLSRTKGSS